MSSVRDIHVLRAILYYYYNCYDIEVSLKIIESIVFISSQRVFPTVYSTEILKFYSFISYASKCI